MQKPDTLATSKSGQITINIQNKKNLNPDFGGQIIPANFGQGHWLFNKSINP
jgi:hypothetical protein